MTDLGAAVRWNEVIEVVHCHACGHVYTPALENPFDPLVTGLTCGWCNCFTQVAVGSLLPRACRACRIPWSQTNIPQLAQHLSSCPQTEKSVCPGQAAGAHRWHTPEEGETALGRYCSLCRAEDKDEACILSHCPCMCHGGL